MTIQDFLGDVFTEHKRATEKYPRPNPNLAALTEEVGELAKALLHFAEGKEIDWDAVRVEAVQVATMAARCALEGDPTVGATNPMVD
ncbi:MAG TPA: hypothetical protein PLJ34_09550 [Hyphomicrobiales bacterium]|nr:hypothetical protein [Kaistiaceae bacterium]HQF31677.1 hypothetical protein [Hyphomicrobiales bacterium]